jgi:hypothetical protein
VAADPLPARTQTHELMSDHNVSDMHYQLDETARLCEDAIDVLARHTLWSLPIVQAGARRPGDCDHLKIDQHRCLHQLHATSDRTHQDNAVE